LSGMLGREIQFMRRTTPATAVSDTWSQNPLIGPVAALTVDGTCFVLDRSGNDSRVVALDLETGEVDATRTATIEGAPVAMCATRDGEHLLVATDLSGPWRLTSVDACDGDATQLAELVGSAPRALASLGTFAALATLDDSLVRVEWSDTPLVTPVRTGLGTPWGIAVDPRAPERVWVAEHDGPAPHAAGRVLEIDFRTGEASPVLTEVGDTASLPAITGLAYRAAHNQLVAICRATGASNPELRELSLGRNGHRVTRRSSLDDGVETLAIGGDGSILTTSPINGSVQAIGGIAASRRVVAYDPATGLAELDAAWNANEPTPYRMPIGRSFRDPVQLAGAPGTGAMVWDSGRDVPSGGRVFVRGTAFDADPGGISAPNLAKPLIATPAVERVELVSTCTSCARLVGCEDLDFDGDLDVVMTTAQGVDLFFQTAPRKFDSTPLFVAVANSGPTFVRDADGDGDIDLFAGDAARFQIAPGLFDSVSVVDEPSTILTVSDLGGDGDIDLVLVVDDEVRVVEQTSPRVFELRAFAWAVADQRLFVGDLDSDGLPDLIASDSLAASRFEVRYGTAESSFSDSVFHIDIPVGIGGTVVAVADVDRNGHADIVVGPGQNTVPFDIPVHVFYQTSRGSFAPTTVGTLRSRIQRVFDFDDNGTLDLVTGVEMLLQSTSGEFEPGPLLPTNAVNDDPVVIDIDQDGTTDFVDHGGAVEAVFSQPSIGADWTNLAIPGAVRARRVSAADIDSDGDLDLVVTGLIDGGVSVFLQFATSFATSPLAVAPDVLGVAASTETADVDGDGDVDLTIADSSNDHVLVVLQTDGALEPSPIVLGDAIVTPAPSMAFPVDLDEDGDRDVLVSSEAGLSWFEQTDPGVFAADPRTIDGEWTPSWVSVRDLDRDGDMDLLTVSREAGALRVFEQGPKGMFQERSVGLTSLGVTFLGFAKFGDFDQDGLVEIATASLLGDHVRIFEQNGPMSFDATPQVLGDTTTTRFPVDIDTLDIDRDGDLDLVVSTSSGLTIFPQLGSGHYGGEPRTIDTAASLGETFGGFGITGLRLGALMSADLDLDGDRDMVGAVQGGLQIWWGGR
ncbi:MAG: VCBS repeat-containing protein, partial [Planctomycetes bacterium]|nr:VCBS repeat-containing protein [Planctomycetota bacterium]